MTTTPHSKTHERQDRDVQAAALAECQRTILALGKQLKGLGTVASQGQEERESSPKSTNSSRSIEKMTENMELLRWQTEAAAAAATAAVEDGAVLLPTAAGSANEHGSPYTSGTLSEHGHYWASTPSPRRAHRSPSPAGARRTSTTIVPGIVHPTRGNESPGVSMSRGAAAAAGLDYASDVPGPVTPKAPSPARSEVPCGSSSAAGSVPGSPSRSSNPTPWALRSRASKDRDVDAHTDSDASVDKSARGSSSFSRFYSRTRSGSVGGSFG